MGEQQRFAGRVAVVTGGGIGIGRSIALRLAAEGAAIALTGRTAETLDETAEEIRRLGGRALGVVADATSQTEMDEAAARFAADLGAPTLVVNNAGGGLATPVGGPAAVWQEQIGRNLTSAAIVSGAFWPGMVRSGGGVVVNIGSIAARLPTPGIHAYNAAKAGIEALTASLAMDGAAHGIRVVCVAPGAVLTPTTQAWIDTHDDPAAKAEELASSSILGRLGSGDDIAAAVAFLASDDASWVTGTTLLVDGGQSIGRT
jgi:NAD(P)-dependent dehydrogenase (short-subunit alcohol dehydrogenase family)